MRILLVEQDVTLASVVKRGLEAERYAVDVTSRGQDGLDLTTTYCYDLIILGTPHPGMNGDELLGRLRRSDGDVPVLILSDSKSLEDKIGLFDLGADDHMTKPFAFVELVFRSKALLRRCATRPSNVVRACDLELDNDTRQVKSRGRPVDLTGREYALLKYLLQNRGRVVTRSMILEEVWNNTDASTSNVIDVHMRQIRRKIDAGDDPKIIQTVRGIGYSIRVCN